MLPAPNLDDRRFQDLVDEAKRYVQQRCPEWTDHNVSDPGVTLIETFASMVDQLMYRLNRVPERHYLKFLELIGVRLYPPTAAHADLTFWLSAARAEPIVVPALTHVATVRVESEDAIVFSTTRDLTVVPCSLSALMTGKANRTQELESGAGVVAFQPVPEPGDTLLFGLSDPVPGCAVLLRLECEVSGIGVDPKNPPLMWQAWNGSDWARCEVDRDTTGGLNRSGDVVVHVPDTHTASVLEGVRAGWLRCQVLESAPRQPSYKSSPRIIRGTASTIGGTVRGVHAETVVGEMLGISEGVPGQRFKLHRTPVVAGGEPLVIQVSTADGWTDWREVASFTESGPDDLHVVVDRTSGEVVFGPSIRLPEGGLRYYGAVPPMATSIRIPSYRTGGGRRGNVARDTLVVLRDPVPFVSTVTNRRPATGGTDPESIADAAVRGPLQLRTRERAVTTEDYEQLAREAAPEALRVRCVPAVVSENSVASEDGVVRVLVVPAVAQSQGRIRFADLKPPDQMLQAVASYLDERRCIGAKVLVEPPHYQGVTVVAQLRPRPGVAEATLQQRALAALDSYLNPLTGGPGGRGWPFGRPVQSGEMFAVLQQVSGVDMVDDIRLFAANPISGQRGDAVARIDVPPHGLIFSFEHQVRVVV